MNDLMAVIFYLIGCLIPGRLLAGYLPTKISYGLIARFAWSSLLGSSIWGLVLLVGVLSGVNRLSYYVVAWIILAIGLITINYKKIKVGRFKLPMIKLKPVDIGLSAIIILILSVGLIIAVKTTVLSYDSLYVWSWRPKLWLSQICQGQAELLSQGSWHLDYPWQISLWQYWLGLLSGGLDNGLVNFGAWWFGLILSALFYSQLRRFCSRSMSLLWLAVLISQPLLFSHSYQTYADLPLATYLLAALILFLEYFGSIKSRVWFGLGVMAGLGFLVKNDAVIFLMPWLICLIAFGCRQWRATGKKIIFFGSGWLIGAGAWLSYLLIHDRGFSNAAPGLIWLPAGLSAMLTSMFWLGSFACLWWLVFSFSVVYIKTIVASRYLSVGWVWLGASLLTLAGLYLLTNAGYFAVNQTAVSRNILLLTPSAVWLLAVTYHYEQIKHNHSRLQ